MREALRDCENNLSERGLFDNTLGRGSPACCRRRFGRRGRDGRSGSLAVLRLKSLLLGKTKVVSSALTRASINIEKRTLTAIESG